jgi:RES domain-containing protein
MQQLILAMRHVDQKTNALTQQQIHLGLFVEYITDKLLSLTKEDGTPLLPVDMDAFPAWAEQRVQSMREEAKAHMESQRAHQETLGAPKGVAQVDLDDES